MLERFLTEHLVDFECDWDVICLANGYYFSARYPGDNSFLVTKHDVDRCHDAVKETRRAVLDYISCHDIKCIDNEDILDDSVTELLDVLSAD